MIIEVEHYNTNVLVNTDYIASIRWGALNSSVIILNSGEVIDANIKYEDIKKQLYAHGFKIVVVK